MSWLNKTHFSAKPGLSLFCHSVMISAALENNSSEGVDEAVMQKSTFTTFDKTGNWHKLFL